MKNNQNQVVEATKETKVKPKEFFFYGTKTIEWKGNSITRRVCYAGIQVGSDTSGAVRIGRAMCSEKDKFDKKKARAIALGRAIKAPEDILYLTDDTTPNKQFINKVKQYVDLKD